MKYYYSFKLKPFFLIITIIFSLIMIIEIKNLRTKLENFNYFSFDNNKINKDDYEYILKPKNSFCGENHGENVLIISFCTISPSAFDFRMEIRKTWANSTNIPFNRLIFILGNSNENQINEKIEKESELYGDIAQFDFIDSYNNLTIKTMMGFRWVSNYCYNAKYGLKIDGDVMVNIYNLIFYLKNLENTNKFQNDSIICRTVRNFKPERNILSKYYISKKEYKNSIYPMYCSGPAYILNINLLKKMYKAFPYTKIIKFEDVSIGLLSEKLGNVNFVDISSYYNEYNENITSIKNHNNIFFYYSYDMYNFLNNWNKFVNKSALRFY